MTQEAALSKSQHLYKKVKLELIRGGFGKGQKFYSINELSGRFKVAPGTAQKVLRELVDDGYLSAVQGKGYIVRSCPDLNEESISESIKPNVVCYIMYGETIHSQTAKILASLNSLCASRGLRLEISSDSESAFAEISHRNDILAVFVENTISLVSRIGSLNKPAICIGHWQGEPGKAINITSDAHQMGKTLVRYLYSLGHRNIGILRISGEDDPIPNEVFLGKFYEGLKLGCIDQGLSWDSIHFALDNSNGGIQYIAQSISNFIERKVTSVFALNWTTALAFVQQTTRQGLTIPGDFSLVCAGESDLTPYIHPKITRFDFGIDEICKRAMQIVFNIRLGRNNINSTEIYLPSELLFGESTGAPAFSKEREKSVYC